VRWLELVLVCEAVSSLVCSSLNCLYFGRYAFATARAAARRVAATALVVVNAALAAEAGAFLALAPNGDGLELALSFALRSLMLLATAFLSLLIWRQNR